MSAIGTIRQQWEASLARLSLECIEAGDNDKAVGAACTREAERAERLFAKLMRIEAKTENDVYNLILLARLMLRDECEGEQISEVLLIAYYDLTDLHVRKTITERQAAA